MSEHRPGSGRLQLSIIALVFFGPLILATWMYMTGRLAPAGGTNHGALLQPVVNLEGVLPEWPALAPAQGRWLMLYANDSACDDGCRNALFRLRQTHLMIGKDMDRVARVFLHGDVLPDTVFLAEEHPGLISITDNGLMRLLEDKRPAELMPGGIFLVDPLTNLVMYFPPDLDPRDMVADVKHLLRLSHIG